MAAPLPIGFRRFFPAGKRSTTVSIASYGNHLCVILCRVWCVIMQNYFDQWMDSECDNTVAFVEPDVRLLAPKLLEDLDCLEPNHPSKIRFLGICKWRPVYQG